MTPDDNKARLRRYVLGALPDDEAEAIEQAYFVDTDALEQVSAVEEELIEDYLEDRLDPESRARFDRHYLSTPGHRERVSVVRGLMTTASRANLTEPARAPAGLTSAPRTATPIDPRASKGRDANVGVSPRWSTFHSVALAASIAVLVGAGAVWWFMARDDRGRKASTPSTVAHAPSNAAPSGTPSTPPTGSPTTPAVAKGTTPATDPSTPSTGSTNAAPAVAEGPRPAQAQPSPDVPRATPPVPNTPRASVIVALSLSAISVRGAGADAPVTIPADVTTLVLRLESDGAAPPLRRGRVVVRTVEGDELWRGPVEAPRASTADARAVVRVPAARLRSGDLIVALLGAGADGHESEQARYTLRITMADRGFR